MAPRGARKSESVNGRHKYHLVVRSTVLIQRTSQ